MSAQRTSTEKPTTPQVALIVAMTRDMVIGSGDNLPWDLPEDLQLFKRLTMGCTVMMGRKTHVSIGRPLPGRHNIVLSHTKDKFPGVQTCNNFMSGLAAAAKLGKPVFVIGGEELYRKALQVASELHVSWIKQESRGDIFFPPLDLSEWTLCAEEDYPDFHYCHYLRSILDKSEPESSNAPYRKLT